MFWQKRRVILTGHTGFKGSWLSLWLQQSGANLLGYSLPPPTQPNLFEAARVAEGMQTVTADICDLAKLKDALHSHRPEIVIHMAAQPLVRLSYQDPVGTYTTNVIGTVNLLEAVRSCDSVRSVVVITSDKCYQNQGWVWAYRENDRLGGHDPYSNSKACAELVVSSFRNSFFPTDKYHKHKVALGSTRAGNVIGGGDWAKDRLIPDIVRAFLKNEVLKIRNPKATRPWQHVLEPLHGYLLLAEQLYEKGTQFAEGWNFGPSYSDSQPVDWMVKKMADLWGPTAHWEIDSTEQPHEDLMLKLDWSKATNQLGWTPKLSLDKALEWTLEWYRACEQGSDMRDFTLKQIAQFEKLSERNTEPSLEVIG
jgi:CDP-glucose 4,6-dehydratase